MSWRAMITGGRILENDYHPDMIEHKMKEAYREGYEDAMEEMSSRYGERGEYPQSSRGNMSDYGQRGDSRDDIRRTNDDFEYRERRGVRGTGPYSRYRY